MLQPATRGSPVGFGFCKLVRFCCNFVWIKLIYCSVNMLVVLLSAVVCFVTVTNVLQQVLQKQVFGNLLDLHTVVNSDLHEGEKKCLPPSFPVWLLTSSITQQTLKRLSSHGLIATEGKGVQGQRGTLKEIHSLMSCTLGAPKGDLWQPLIMSYDNIGGGGSPHCSAAGCRTSKQAWPAESWPPPACPGDYPYPGWLWKCKWNRWCSSSPAWWPRAAWSPSSPALSCRLDEDNEEPAGKAGGQRWICITRQDWCYFRPTLREGAESARFKARPADIERLCIQHGEGFPHC